MLRDGPEKKWKGSEETVGWDEDRTSMRRDELVFSKADVSAEAFLDRHRRVSSSECLILSELSWLPIRTADEDAKGSRVLYVVGE